MPYCERCRTKLPSDAKYCPSCGCPVGKIVTEKFSISADNLIETVKELIHEGNVTRIIIKDDKGRGSLGNACDSRSYRSITCSLASGVRCYCSLSHKLHNDS